MKVFKLKELIIDIDKFKIEDLNQISKLVLTFNKESQLKKFNTLYSEILLKKIYPLTKGIPFCRAKIEHCIELFHSKGTGKKKQECNSCKLKKYCNYNSEKFNIKPITNPSEDLIKFLEERNESLNDWI